VLAQLKRDPAARLWPQCRNAGALQRCGPQGRPDNLAAPRRWTLMSEPRANCGAASSRRSLALAVRPGKSRAVVNASPWTCLSATWRRSWHAHRGRQMTLEGIACLVAGFTARSIALAITSCDHTATRSRLTSKSPKTSPEGGPIKLSDYLRIYQSHRSPSLTRWVLGPVRHQVVSGNWHSRAMHRCRPRPRGHRRHGLPAVPDGSPG